MAAAERLTGACVKYSVERGFGFIQPADGASDDVFVHHRSLQSKGFRSLDVGEKVEYELNTNADGKLEAVNVTGPDGAELKGNPDGVDAKGKGKGKGGGAAPPPKPLPKLSQASAARARPVRALQHGRRAAARCALH